MFSPSISLAFVSSLFFAALGFAQDNLMYGYPGTTTCSSKDFTIILEPGQCIGVTNPPSGYQSTSAAFFEDGCQGMFLHPFNRAMLS